LKYNETRLSNIIRKSQKSKLRKGDEIVGFILMLPIIVSIIIVIMGASQIGICNQKLTTLAYNACRAAIVSDNYDDALENARLVYKSNMTPNLPQNEYLKLEIIKDMNNGNPVVYDDATTRIGRVNGQDIWLKGKYVKCTVRYKLDTVLPFTSGVRERSIIMMIENDQSQ
jgi:hypothetical protein